jgi:hypothetical protein
MGRETASGEVLHTEGTMREDRRPDFRPTSKCNKAFTPLRTTSFVPYGRLSFPFFIWVVFFFFTFFNINFFFFFFHFWCGFLKLRSCGLLPSEVQRVRVVYHLIFKKYRANKYIIRWLDLRDSRVNRLVSLSLCNQFSVFLFFLFFVSFACWFIQLLFIDSSGFRNGLMIGGRSMRTENNWQPQTDGERETRT